MSGGDYCVDYRGRAVMLRQVMEQYDIKPGCRILMMDEAMVVGTCKNCKKHNLDECPITDMCGDHNVWIDKTPDYFGCVMWEGK